MTMKSAVPFEKIAPYLEATFTPNGRTLDEGFDCYGFVRALMRDIYDIDVGDQWSDVDIDDAPIYFTEQKSKAEKGESRWRKVDSPADAHIVLLKRKGIISHIGFVLDDKRFIHLTHKSNVRIDRFDSPLWKNQIEGFYRYG